MVSNPNSVNVNVTYKCSSDQFRRVIALLQWLEHYNNNGSARRPSFRRAENAGFDEKPDTGFWDANTQDGRDAIEENSNNENAPGLYIFLEMMQFIQAVNDSSLDITAVANPGTNDYDRYLHKPTQKELNDIVAQKEARQQLANEMLHQLTRFNVSERFAEKRSSFTESENKVYDMFSALHAIALDRRGSGKGFDQEGQSRLVKGGRRIIKSGVAFILFPVFILAGGAFAIGNLLGYRRPALSTSYGSWGDYLYSVFAGASFAVGESGANYIAEAGLESVPGKRSFAEVFNDNDHGFIGPVRGSLAVVGYGLHQIFVPISVALATLPEIIVKSFLFPLKWALEYDQWAQDGYARRAVDTLESTLIGILSSPIILLNHLYASIVEVAVKTFSSPKDDPGLKDAKKLLKDYLDIDLNLTNPSWSERIFFIAPYKLMRLVLDTFPRILSRTLINTARSIFPAIPGTTKGQRDKFFDVVERGVYSTLFMINLLLVGSFLAVVSGATLTGGLAALFGSEVPIRSAGQLFSSYGGQIWNIMQNIGSGIGSLFTNPVSFFKETLNLGNFTSMFQQGGFFGKDGALANAFSGIKNWQGTTWLGVSLTVVLGAPLAWVASKLAPKWYEKYQQSNQQQNNESLVPSHKDAKPEIHQKMAKLGPTGEQAAKVTAQLERKVASVSILFDSSGPSAYPPTSPSSASTNSTSTISGGPGGSTSHIRTNRNKQ